MEKKNKNLRNLFIWLVYSFLYLPIIILVIFSFNKSKMNIVFSGFTLDWYAKLFQNTDLLEAFGNTMLIAVLSTAISTIIGTMSAVALQKYNFPGKTLVNRLIYIPIVIPEIVLGISLLSVYTLVHLNLGIFSILLSHIAFSIPFVITSVRSNLSQLSSDYEEASYDLGAGKIRTFFSVTLPLITPGVISGATLAFTLSLDDVVISYFTAGPGSNTLPLKIYSMIKTGITPDVNALSSLILITVIIVLIVPAYIQSKNIQKRSKS